MSLEQVSVQSNPNTRGNSPTTTSGIINRRWTPRRRGACAMCKLKKVRCDGATPCVNCRRHNQECHYPQSKKRQASKNSIDSAGSDKASPLTDVSNTTTIYTSEAPGSLTKSTSLPLLHTDKLLHNLPDTSQSNSYTGTPKSDQSTVHTFGDEYAKDPIWNIEIDPEGVHSLIPTTDVTDIFDLSKFSWPPSVTDISGPFDFDIPFVTDHNDTAMSLDFKPMPKSFLDPIPSVNFSLKAIFSWQYRGYDNMSGAKQDEVYQIFRRICPVQAEQTSLSLSEKIYPPSYAAWYWNNAAIMDSCRTASFEQPLGIPNLLSRTCFDRYIKEARTGPQGNAVLVSLIDSVMAFGFHAFLKSSRRSVSPSDKQEADYYARVALSGHSSVLRAPDNLLKLQAILAMATVSESIDDVIHSDLLTGGVNCARALKLESSDLVHQNYTSNEDRDLARRSLWFLYSIEVPHSLRRGLSPSLDRDWIDHAPPQACDEGDWFQLQCLYSHVLSSAAEMLYRQSALRQSFMEREQKLDVAFKLLEDWRDRLPATLKEIHSPDIHRIMDDQPISRHIALSMFRQYHEAIFMIYFPWSGGQSGGEVSEACRRRGMELCVSSAQVVLATANQVSSLDILDSKFIELISVSICMTFLDVASSQQSQKSISYLSMGCGIFGRLNLEKEVPLVDVLELTRIAQQIKMR